MPSGLHWYEGQGGNCWPLRRKNWQWCSALPSVGKQEAWNRNQTSTATTECGWGGIEPQPSEYSRAASMQGDEWLSLIGIRYRG